MPFIYCNTQEELEKVRQDMKDLFKKDKMRSHGSGWLGSVSLLEASEKLLSMYSPEGNDYIKERNWTIVLSSHEKRWNIDIYHIKKTFRDYLKEEIDNAI